MGRLPKKKMFAKTRQRCVLVAASSGSPPHAAQVVFPRTCASFSFECTVVELAHICHTSKVAVNHAHRRNMAYEFAFGVFRKPRRKSPATPSLYIKAGTRRRCKIPVWGCRSDQSTTLTHVKKRRHLDDPRAHTFISARGFIAEDTTWVLSMSFSSSPLAPRAHVVLMFIEAYVYK